MSIALKLTTLVVPYGSDEYRAALDLRDRLLRQPLGLRFTEEELRQDRKDYHIVTKLDEQVIGCLILTPHEDGMIKMRQVAVDEQFQRQGVGQALVEDAEFFAREKSFKTIYCHARDTAVAFYEELGYHKVGNTFISVTIEHWRMEKELG